MILPVLHMRRQQAFYFFPVEVRRERIGSVEQYVGHPFPQGAPQQARNRQREAVLAAPNKVRRFATGSKSRDEPKLSSGSISREE